MSTEAALVIIGAALVLITLLGWLAGRSENRRAAEQAAAARRAERAVAPGYANEAAYADVAREAELSLRSERDAVLGEDGSERERRAVERPVRTLEREQPEADPEAAGDDRTGGGRFAREDRVPRGH